MQSFMSFGPYLGATGGHNCGYLSSFLTSSKSSEIVLDSKTSITIENITLQLRLLKSFLQTPKIIELNNIVFDDLAIVGMEFRDPKEESVDMLFTLSFPNIGYLQTRL